MSIKRGGAIDICEEVPGTVTTSRSPPNSKPLFLVTIPTAPKNHETSAITFSVTLLTNNRQTKNKVDENIICCF